MRKLIKIYIMALAGVLALNACGDLLDLEPREEISETAVWNDIALMKAYLADVYFGLYHGAKQVMTDAMADNATSVPPGQTNSIHQGTITPSSLGYLTHQEHLRWEWNYKYIRHTNKILANIDNSPFEQKDKDEIKGQALFLRANFYHNLLKTHGGVPYITKVYSLADDDMSPPRNSFGETAELIVKDLTDAAVLLPVSWGTAKGQATKGAAYALMSRVLLYAASDLYHVNPSGMAVTGYTTAQNRSAMWRAAKNAAQQVIDLGIYSLFNANPVPGDSIEENYYRLFLTPYNAETILERYFTGSERHGRNANYTPNTYHGPNGFHQWGGTTPTQQFVDAFQMRDGSEFDWNNPEHATVPYKNRDPRFHATILYDGSHWMTRGESGIGLDPEGVVQTFAALSLPDGNVVPGLDTRMSHIDPHNGTESGYYMRKYLNQDLPLRLRAIPGVWIWIRYAEVLLNYAEASFELGEEVDARWALNQLRRRAGMPEYGADVSGGDLKKQLRYERRIELCFEEHRFFDIRRWMIAPQVIVTAKGIRITAEATDRRYRSTYSNYNYEFINVQTRQWHDKLYFWPILQEERNRNANLVQNPGY